jgi:2-methylcitrate dehydratase PrpD
MAKVDVVGDPRCDAIYPHQFPAIVTVTTTDGTTLVEEVLTNRGGPARPLSPAELGQKFTDNVAGRLDPATAQTLRDRVAHLDACDDIAALLAPLARLTSGDPS